MARTTQAVLTDDFGQRARINPPESAVNGKEAFPGAAHYTYSMDASTNRTTPDVAAAPLSTELEFTRVYRENQSAHPALRELRCLQVYIPALFQAPQPGDLLVGRVRYPLCGFSPQPGGYGYYCQAEAVKRILSHSDQGAEWKCRVEEMLRFWEAENSQSKTRHAYPADLAKALPSDSLSAVRAAFPLYRLGGTQLDYQTLVSLGLPGLKAKVKASPVGDAILKQALVGMVDLLGESARALAERLPSGNADLAKNLAFIPERAPKRFREAMQLFYFAAVAAGSWNYGRLDVVLGPFLSRDLEAGVLTEEDAVSLTQSLFRLMDRSAKWDHRVALGGLGRPDEKAADLFVRVALEATRRHRDVVPQVTLRFHPRQDPAIMKQALDVLGEGTTFPMLYNDAVNVPSAMKAMGVPEADALDYLPFGCGEYMLWRKSIATPSGALNIAKCLELALGNGRCALTGEQVGPATGEPSSWVGFEDAFAAYAAQVEHGVSALARQQKIEYETLAREAPFLLFTLLHDDCLAKGLPVLGGGLRHLSGTLETYGNTDAADALTALAAVMAGRLSFGLPKLREALEADWVGFEKERGELLALPKYGNDLEEADAMALRVHGHVCNFTRAQAAVVGLDSYLVVIINNSMNVNLGAMTAALPDGRRKGEPLANGNNPVAGRDRQGVTAFLRSLSKLPTEIHAGAVQNMKFGKNLFTRHRGKLEALLSTWWALGGAQAMLTVLDRGDLEAAMLAPEKWGHLMVRVGGFSARFVELPRELQAHILARTLNE